jgi:hypothetical protein
MDGNIEERLDRLENKMKVGFFEVEKKLVKLETSSSASMDERVQELEDLLLLLQLDNMRLKEKVSSTDTTQPDIGERVSSMGLSEEVPSNIESRLNQIENKISSLKTGGNEFSEERLDETEKRLSSVEKIYKEVSNIRDRLNMLDEMVSMRGNVSGMEKLEGFKKRVLEEMDARLLEINGKINRIEVPSGRELVMKGMEDRMDELEKNVSLAVEESENISKTFEKRLSLLERGSKIREIGLESIDKKLNSIERQLPLLSKDADKIDFFSKEISEIDKRLNLLELRQKPERGKVLSEVEKILGERDGEKNPRY